MDREVHALNLAFDYAFIIHDLLHDILKRSIRIDSYVDSKSVFDIIAKDGCTTERRLQTYIHTLKESYERGELANLSCISVEKNPADTLTKETVKLFCPLLTLMNTNRISLTPTGWANVMIETKNALVANDVMEKRLDRKLIDGEVGDSRGKHWLRMLNKREDARKRESWMIVVMDKMSHWM